MMNCKTNYFVAIFGTVIVTGLVVSWVMTTPAKETTCKFTTGMSWEETQRLITEEYSVHYAATALRGEDSFTDETIYVVDLKQSKIILHFNYYNNIINIENYIGSSGFNKRSTLPPEINSIEHPKSYTYKIVNLKTGKYKNVAEIPDLLTNEIYKTTHLVLKLIPAGKFQMGDHAGTDKPDELPVHTVYIPEPFYIGVFEITRGQWLCIKSKPLWYIRREDKTNYSKRPVAEASWYDINEEDGYLDNLNYKTGLKFQLPTEAQWEYACRAGTTTIYSFGNTLDNAYMWAKPNRSIPLHEVGKKLPNPWGLYDMHGNVSEWCLDIYTPNYYGRDYENNPKKSPNGEKLRVTRGGNCFSEVTYCRSAARFKLRPHWQKPFLGFRLVLTEEAHL